jgi:hypothetical protein
MKTTLPRSSAARLLLLLFGLLALFHLGIISGLLPDELVWAGQYAGSPRLIRMELLALGFLLLAALIVSLKAGFLRWPVPMPMTRFALWLLFALFVLNTLGNATAPHPIERYGFGALTAAMALLTFCLARER